MDKMDKVEIFTDGACKGNPGPGGWGALLVAGTHEKELFGGELGTTNNRMELMAVIEALNALSRPCEVIVHTDSQYVQKGISEWIHGWKARGWKTAAKAPVKNEDLWKQLDQAQARHKIEWRWVRGHNGHAGNERADALANLGNQGRAERDAQRHLSPDRHRLTEMIFFFRHSVARTAQLRLQALERLGGPGGPCRGVHGNDRRRHEVNAVRRTWLRDSAARVPPTAACPSPA